jgi:hypothetical protein
MGRTLPPFSQLIEYERRAWAPFRRALRKDDQKAFDHLFDCAKLHVQAGVYLSRPWPFEVVAMAMLLEHHKRLEQLLTQFEALCHRTRSLTTPALEELYDPPALTDQSTRPPVSSPSLLPSGEEEQTGIEVQYPKPPHACPSTDPNDGEGTHDLPEGLL